MTVERVLAPNPGIYTGPGTNTYLVADGNEVAVIDPGPVIETHLLAIVEAIGDRTAVAVIATHTHPDHAPLSNPLAERLGVPVFGYGPGPEFEPDVRIADDDEVPVGARHLRAVHTPGHSADHLCFTYCRIDSSPATTSWADRPSSWRTPPPISSRSIACRTWVSRELSRDTEIRWTMPEP